MVTPGVEVNTKVHSRQINQTTTGHVQILMQ